MTTTITPETCAHQRGHISDSRFYGNRYATAASRRIFCDMCRNQRWLDIEAALALEQAELGMIPHRAAELIAGAATIELLDLDAVQAEIERTGHSLVGLLRPFREAVPEGAGQFIHYGATTQDIQDTGQSLEMRDVLDELTPVLTGIIARLADLAEQHAATVAVGRTHAQPALPIGFGLKIASWVDELLRHLDRIDAARERVLAAQLFGGAGTMAGFQQHGAKLLEGFARRLGLHAPAIGWHTARDRVVEYATVLAMTSGTLGRVADEIRTLSRPEFGELREAWRPGKVGSSTMPHKRNPEGCEQVVVMARLAAAGAGTAFLAMVGDHERDARSLRLEWACVPDVSHYTLAAAEILHGIVSGLTVDAGQARSNVDRMAWRLVSERLMFAVAEQIGKENAHELVYDVTQRVQDSGEPLRDVLREVLHRRDLPGLPAARLDDLLDPSGYLGESAALTAGVVARARQRLGGVTGSTGSTGSGGRDGEA